MSIRNLLNKLEKAEQRFLGAKFLAPVVGRGRVTVRLAGVVCRLCVRSGLPEGFSGWAVFRSTSLTEAQFVREATLLEVRQYLDLLPRVRLVLVERQDRRWLALPARIEDRRFRIEGPVVVWLTEDGLERFDTVLARLDGRLFWHDERDPIRDPALADYLRKTIAQFDESGRAPPQQSVRKAGLSREERLAYAWVWEGRTVARQESVESRIQDALGHGGASLQSYTSRGDTYVVTYKVDGQAHRSTVRHDDFTVLSAGVCLDGEDRKFDLTSLVGVIREGQQRDEWQDDWM